MLANTIQNNFASGELSPNLWARTDRPFYKSGVEVSKNFLPLLTGGLFFRRGFRYSIHTRLNQDVWGSPFRFNVDQAYTLEFTASKLRIHTDGGVILETAKAITGVSQADPGVVTCTGHGFSSGDEVYFSGVVGATYLNAQFFLVVYIDANTFSLTDIDGNAIDTTLEDAYVSGGTVARVYEIDSPYTVAEAKTIKYFGSADLMYLVCKTREPRVLIRSGSASWSIASYSRYSSTLAITGISQANPGVITCAGHGLISGDRVYISHVEGMSEINGSEYLVVYINTSTFSLTTLAGAAIDTSAYGAYTSGGNIALVRDAGLAISGVTKANPGVVTCTGHGFSTNDKIYISGISGMTELNGNYYWVKKIDANTFSLMTELGVDVNTTSFTTWSSGGTAVLCHGLFTKLGDFPGAGGLYGSRCWLGGTDNDPDVFWGSMASDVNTGESQYDNFTIGTTDVDAIVYVLTSQNFSAHRIYWFSGTPNFMVIGTSSGVYKANGGSDGSAITPTAIYVTPVSSVGAADLMPLLVGGQTYYLEQGLRTIRGFGYSLIDDSYKSFDKNVLADEITAGGIVQIAYAKGRPELIYAVRSDGVLLTCTILEQDDVAGWARHPIAGDGKVLSVVTESQSADFDRVGIFVERTINGATRRYLEYLATDPEIPEVSDYFTGEANQVADRAAYEKVLFEAQKQFIRMDSAVVLDNTQSIGITLAALTGDSITVTADSAVFTSDDVGKFIFAKFLTGVESGIAEIIDYVSTTEVTVRILEDFSALTFAASAWYLASASVGGLGHLEGEVVGVMTDGAVHADLTVADGHITLEYPSRYVVIGKKYTGIGRTVDLEITAANGVSQARLRSVEKLFVKFRNTLGGKFGTTTKNFYNLTELMFRRAGSSYYDRPPALFSGLKPIPIRDTWANEKKLYFVQDQPFPMTILAIIPSEDIGEVE